MGNKNIVKDFLGELGWWLYWRVKWQDNRIGRDLFDPHTLQGKQTRDNLLYFIMNGHPEFENEKKPEINITYGCPYKNEDCPKCCNCKDGMPKAQKGYFICPKHGKQNEM